MGPMNYEAALRVVDEWLERLDQYLDSRKRLGTSQGWDEVTDHDRWFNERLPLVQSISRKFCPTETAVHKWAMASKVPWIGTRDHLLQVRGLLSQRNEYHEIFTPLGPNLSAQSLHPWVWDAAKHLWSDGHYRSAVGNAATQLEVMLQSKVARADLSGAKLVGEAFSLSPAEPGKPRLRFDGIDTASERFRSAHIGAMHLGQGCFEGIRNWAAHSLEEEDEQTSLEFLAALSVFARWVERAGVAVSA